MKIHHLSGVLLSVLVLAACKREEPAPEIASQLLPGSESSAASDPTPVRKYAEKSGIIESKSNAFGEITTVVYFDDYGAREATYTTSEIEVMGQKTVTREVEINADGWTIKYDPDARTGERWNMAAFNGGSVPPPNLPSVPGAPQMGPEQMGSMQPTELEPRTIAGREAVGMEMEIMGMKTRTWTWSNIAMRTEVYMGGEEPMVTEVTSLRLGEPVPAEKFAVPADVRVTEVKI